MQIPPPSTVQAREGGGPPSGPGAPVRFEVSCDDCGLGPVCRVLEFGEPGSGVPEGVLLRRRPVSRGEIIFRGGDPFHAFFAVKSGSFKALAPAREGAVRVLGFQFAGELVGIEGIADNRYPYTARALENSAVCELSVERLPESGKPLEALQRSVIEMLGEVVTFNQEMIACLIHQSADQRVAGFLLGVSKRLKRRGMNGETFTLSMSRSDIASYLGLASETVSRILTRLDRSGCIRLRHRRLQIARGRELERVAGG